MLSETDVKAEPSRGPLLSRVSAMWSVAAIVVFAAAGVVLLLAMRKQWFFYDEWSYLARDPVGDFSFSQLFVSHNGHLIVWTNAWFQLLLQVFGLKYYVLYGVPILLAHVGAAAAGMSAARSLGGSRWLALIAAFGVLLMGAGARNILWAGQFSYVLPVTLFLAWVALVLRDHRLVGERLGWRSALVLSVVGGLSSLVFLPFALTLAALSATRRRWAEVAAFVGVTVPLALVGILTDPARGSRPTSLGLLSRVRASLAYVWEGLTTAMANGPGRPAVLGVVVLALTWGGIALIPAGRRRLTALALAVGPVVFFAVTSIGRADLGAGQAVQPRYLYVTLACTVPLWVAELGGLSRLVRRRGSRNGALAVLAGAGAGMLIYSAWSASFFWSEASTVAAAKGHSHGVVSASVPLLQDPSVTPEMKVEPLWAPPLTVAQTRWYADTGRLGLVTPSRRDQAQAAVNLFWVATRDRPAPATGCIPVTNSHIVVRARADQVLAVYPDTATAVGILTPSAMNTREIDKPVGLSAPTTIRAVSAAAPDVAFNITAGSAVVCVRPAP